MHPLISVSDLDQLISQSKPVLVFDCSSDLVDPEAGYKSFVKEHIPTAYYADSNTDLSGPKNGLNGRHPLPSLAKWERTLQSWGITPTSHVVAYDRQGNMFAARLWWMLRSCGLTNVQVLDGGFSAWKRKGLAVEVGEACKIAQPSHLKLHKEFEGLKYMTDVRENLQTAKYLIIDARPNDRFHGQNEILDPIAGHIPGAVNRCFKDNLDTDGFFKSPDTLRNEFSNLMDRDSESIIHQCGSGATACHNHLSMELAGLSGSKIYAGSWSEWCAHPENPITTD